MNLEPRELAACVGAGICSLFAYLLHHQAERLLDLCSALKAISGETTARSLTSSLKPGEKRFVAVRGRVECSNPLKTKNGTQAVSITSQVVEHSDDYGSKLSKSNILSENTSRVPFVIVDSALLSSLAYKIHVPDVRSISLPEVVLEESFHDVKISSLDRFMAAVSGHKSIKGYQHVDKGLAVGMTVTGIGFASYDGVSGQLVLSSSPQFRIIICFETLAEYIEKTLADRGLLRKSAVVFGTAAACALGYVVFKRVRQHQQRQQRAWDAARQLERRAARPRAPSTEQACIICLDNERDVVVQPCRHMCLCSPCAAQLQETSTLCPVCRARFTSLDPVFL